MKKTAIIYYSVHHNNTEKLVNSTKNADIYNINDIKDIDFSQYDLVGFASGIYMGKFHNSITDFIKKHLNELKDVFLVYTSGSNNEKYGVNLKKELENSGLNVLGVYSCKGFDTYGPFKLIGGISKNHPDQTDMDKFKKFIDKLS